ncbi:protein kinase [Myxococcus sp. K15C18031901]|uniref:protein kinase domain-containing protein n=1 Tax=Myxococcus dinghuensis TaxID=2906761 RepID=UPI0020A83560|nr:protein kinase [Myxococcus dinghuensis]MCP3098385.1 protein kinase [Myxococcus dinghuensis]
MARPVEPEPLAGPVRFGPYTLVRRIGAGGMGEVFLAREEAPRRACVVKKVLPQLMASPQFVGRFRDEARVVVRLQHANIARVYAMGEEEGQLYLAMEYVQGKTLSRLTYRLRQLGKMMPLGVLLHLGQRLCEGLAYAHDATDEEGHSLHLVHRDLSPANICLSYAGDVKIIDFGAAQSTLKEQQTAPRVVIGNLTYMSPEQARKRFVDRRADVYAVGVLLWELSAWKTLPQRGDPVERWRRAAYPQWESAGRYRQGLPTSVDAFLVRALAPEPSERFPDAAAMGAELARLKEKLAPGVGDAEVARLMGLVFPREKKAEEALLRELLREESGRTGTDPGLAAALAPPTALAFEHNAVITPDDFIASEGARVGPPPSGSDSTPTQALSADHVRARAGAPAGQDDEPTLALSAEQLRARVAEAEAQAGASTQAVSAEQLRARMDAPGAQGGESTLALSAEQLRARVAEVEAQAGASTQAVSAEQLRARMDAPGAQGGESTQASSAEQVRARLQASGTSRTHEGVSGVQDDAPTQALSSDALRVRLGPGDDEPTRTEVSGQTPGERGSGGEDSTVVEEPARSERVSAASDDEPTRTEVSPGQGSSRGAEPSIGTSPQGPQVAARSTGVPSRPGDDGPSPARGSHDTDPAGVRGADDVPVRGSRPVSSHPPTGSAFLSSEDEPTAVDDPRKLPHTAPPRTGTVGSAESAAQLPPYASGGDEPTTVGPLTVAPRAPARQGGDRPFSPGHHASAPVSSRAVAPPPLPGTKRVAEHDEDESTVVAPRSAAGPSSQASSQGTGDDETTAVGPRAASHVTGAPQSGPGEDEVTAVDSPLRRGRSAAWDASPPLGSGEGVSGTSRYGAVRGPSVNAPESKAPPDATEALDAAKLLVAIAEASERPSGTKASLYPGRAEDTVTPTMEGTRYKANRRVPRETQVGFGIDISQTVDTAAIEAKRLELVRAITGDGELPVPEPTRTGTWLQGPRLWIAGALFAGACLLGLSVVWWLWR